MKLTGNFHRRRLLARLRRAFFLPTEQVFTLPRHWKQSLLVALDLCLIPGAIWLAVLIRWGNTNYQFTASDFIAVMLTMVFSASYFVREGFYRAIVRFMGQQAILTIIKGVTVSAIVLAVAGFLTGSKMPRSTPLVYWAVALALVGGSRLAVRSFYHGVLRRTGDKVAIYGAGVSGRQLLTALFQTGDYWPVVFIDDDPALSGTVINGVSVYDSAKLAQLRDEFAFSHVFLALPSASHKRRREIIDQLESLPVYVKTVPDFGDLVTGAAKVGQLQDIELADLLGRDPVPPDPRLLRHCIAGKVVMVTGAGGSIGSELCRQIVQCQPRELVLFDISEYALYEISKELESRQIPIVPLLGSVLDEAQLTAVIAEYEVATVYHAAAYKHVPMVEYNMAAGVSNNVLGTLAAARAALHGGVETFVLISTDKAVRPTNVMGASKRMAELVLQAFAEKYQGTRFCMVRFGNVLGSSGSVVPLFRQQIHAGGPVTVTHKDITRFFMTIPEAAQLVLQASAMGQGGDVFVLDMGEPVRILSLAKRLIRLMGCEVRDAHNRHGDIEIQFTGLRPGEKLYEELLLGDKVTGTGHPKIMRAEEERLGEAQVDQALQVLQDACRIGDCDAILAVLQQTVSGFLARDGISDALWRRRRANGKQLPARDNVVHADFNQHLN